MSYVIDRPIMTFVNEERARCAALVKKFARGKDVGFLAYCIDQNLTTADNLAGWRKRYEELGGDNIDDLF